MAPTPKMTAEEAAEVFESMIDSGDIFFEQDEKDAARVAIARLRATCGNCQHFDIGPSDDEEIRGWCGRDKNETKHFVVPIDGSGYCHEHTPKARQT